MISCPVPNLESHICILVTIIRPTAPSIRQMVDHERKPLQFSRLKSPEQKGKDI